MIMDEPTSSLTEREARQLFGIIEDLTAGGVGVVYISHRLEEIFEISDRITVLRDGHHIKTAPASELDAEELVRLMVGRPLNELFTRSESSPGRGRPRGPGPHARRGVRGRSLALRAGEILGLAGLVGAGRTELAQAIFGIRPPESGEILVDGEEAQHPLPAGGDGERGYSTCRRSAGPRA